MNQKFIIFLLVYILVTGLSQKKIENKLTNKHKQIKGTKVSLIPADGFTDGVNFHGLQQVGSGSSIMVLDIPGPYSETSKGITKENLLSQGVEMSNIEKFTLNQLPAIFVTGTQNANGNIYTKYILIFGNDSETHIINGSFPKNLKKIGQELRKSMLSVYYDETKVIDPFETIDYEINVSETKIKFAKSFSNSLIFTVDGKIPTTSDDKTSLIIAKSFSQISIEDQKLFSINRLKQLPSEIEKIEFTNEITIDGVNGYELFAKAKDKKSGVTENIYQVILFSDKLYYLLVGTTNDESSKSIEELKKIILTFRRK